MLVIILLIFGPKRLPGLGKSLGSGMRNFKDSIAGKDKDEDEDEEEDERPELTAAQATSPMSVPPNRASRQRGASAGPRD